MSNASNFQPQYQVPPQQFAPSKKHHRWIPWVAYPTVLLFGVIIGSTSGGSDTSASSPGATTTVTVPAKPGSKVTVPGPTVTKTVPGPRTTVTAQPPQAAAAITEDGMYLVGTDIKPGTYRNGNESDCYWARLRNLSGGLDSIIANGLGGNQVVTIKRTDKAFETTRCGEWRRVS